MHALLMILLGLVGFLIVILGFIAFLLFSAFMTVQPIMSVLGKISMYIWYSDIAQGIARRFGWIQKK